MRFLQSRVSTSVRVQEEASTFSRDPQKVREQPSLSPRLNVRPRDRTHYTTILDGGARTEIFSELRVLKRQLNNHFLF